LNLFIYFFCYKELDPIKNHLRKPNAASILKKQYPPNTGYVILLRSYSMSSFFCKQKFNGKTMQNIPVQAFHWARDLSEKPTGPTLTARSLGNAPFEVFPVIGVLLYKRGFSV
jgi:hypothetical protein